VHRPRSSFSPPRRRRHRRSASALPSARSTAQRPAGKSAIRSETSETSVRKNAVTGADQAVARVGSESPGGGWLTPANARATHVQVPGAGNDPSEVAPLSPSKVRRPERPHAIARRIRRQQQAPPLSRGPLADGQDRQHSASDQRTHCRLRYARKASARVDSTLVVRTRHCSSSEAAARTRPRTRLFENQARSL